MTNKKVCRRANFKGLKTQNSRELSPKNKAKNKRYINTTIL